MQKVITFLNANKVLLFGLFSAVAMTVQQLTSTYATDYKVLALAAIVAALGFLAKNLRGQWASIIGSLVPSVTVVLTNLESHTPISWWQFGGAVALALGGVFAPPSKSLSYETSPTIVAAKTQASQTDAAQDKSVPVSKLPIIVFILCISSMCNAQSMFSSLPKPVVAKPNPFARITIADTLTPGMNYNGLRFTGPTVLYALPNSTVFTGVGVDWESDTYNMSTGKFYTNWAIGLQAMEGGQFAPQTVSAVTAGALTVSFFNKLVTLALIYNFTNKNFMGGFGPGVNLNN